VTGWAGSTQFRTAFLELNPLSTNLTKYKHRVEPAKQKNDEKSKQEDGDGFCGKHNKSD